LIIPVFATKVTSIPALGSAHVSVSFSTHEATTQRVTAIDVASTRVWRTKKQRQLTSPPMSLLFTG